MDTRLDLEREALGLGDALSECQHERDTALEQRDALAKLITDLRAVVAAGGWVDTLRIITCACPVGTFARRPEAVQTEAAYLERIRDADWHNEKCVWRRVMQADARERA